MTTCAHAPADFTAVIPLTGWGGELTPKGRSLKSFHGRDVLCATYGVGAAPEALRKSCEELERLEVVRTMNRNRPANASPIFRCHRLREVPPGPARVSY